MGKKIILSLLIVLLLTITINVCIAEETVNVKKNIPKIFALDIVNNNTHNMKDVHFIVEPDYADMFVFPPPFNVTKNTTKTIIYNITCDFEGIEYVDVVMRYYQIYNTTFNSETHNIDIYNNVIDPINITIHKGDTLNFTNKLDRPINIYESESNTWNHDINISESYLREFNAIENIKYVADLNIGFINVIDNVYESYQHFTADDIELTFKIVSSLTDADITIQLLDESVMTIDWDGYSSGNILINPTGFVSDLDIKLIKMNNDENNVIIEQYNDWFTFTPNNIDISSPTVFNYVISPRINHTNQTNMTYIFEIDISSDNSNDESVRFNVTIPFKDLSILDDSNTTIVLITEDQIRTYMPTYCRENPDSCIGEVQYVYLNSTKNSTEIKIDEAINEINNLENKIIQMSSKLNNLTRSMDTVSVKMNWLENFKKAEIQVAEQAESDSKAKTIIKWFIIVIIILIMIGIGGYYGIQTIQERNAGGT